MIATTIYAKDRLGQDLPVVVPADELNDTDLKLINYCAGLYPGAAFVAGVQGSGKTMFLGMVAFCFKYYFNIDTVADFHFRSPEDGGNKLLFHSYKYMDDEQMLIEQDKMYQVAKEYKKKFNEDESFRDKVAGELWDEYEKVTKVNLHEKIICWDEVYQKMEKRRPMDPLNILYSQMLKQYRHYYSLILMAAPRLDECDRRIDDNIRLEISSDWEKERIVKMDDKWYLATVNAGHYRTYDRDKHKYLPLLHLEGKNWWPLIYSFQMVTPRKRMIGADKEG